MIGLTTGCPRKKPPTTATAAPPVVEAPAPVVEKPAETKPVVTVQPATTPTKTEVVTPALKPVAIVDEGLSNRTAEELSALLKPVFFVVDSSDLDSAGQAVATANAELLRKNVSWKVTIEGHADERGTPEYNLALGERRANAVKAYLVSLGVSADRLTALSYGEEFPFDPGHDEGAWAKNRRAYFQVTGK
jgi:peptidoglycan-associated lipoprotein